MIRPPKAAAGPHPGRLPVVKRLAVAVLAAVSLSSAAWSQVALGPELQVNTYTTDAQAIPSVASDASGNFIVAWQSVQDGSSDSIIAARFDASGNPVGGEFLV